MNSFNQHVVDYLRFFILEARRGSYTADKGDTHTRLLIRFHSETGSII